LRITFFTGSIVGYIDNPAALLTRGLAHGLALRGHDVRAVERRRNGAFVRTMEAIGAGASRHFYESFPTIQHHTYEGRTGAQLLEWVTRETALIDIAVAVGGLDDELCRWIANVSRDRLARSYLSWSPAHITPQRFEDLEIERFDVVLTPFTVDLPANARPILATVAGADIAAGLTSGIDDISQTPLADPIEAAIAFERVARLPAIAQ
jgi:hypothetical protein